MRALTNADLTTDAAFLVDFQKEGAPLVISFGFYNNTGDALFNFYGRLKKLEQISGQPLNKILLRDPSQCWYLRGIAGLGDDVDTTIAALRDLIAPLQPSSITTIGQSMGGYSALLYGLLLGVDKIIAFGPLSSFDGRIWQLLNDWRWEVQRQSLLRDQPAPHPYYDLPSLFQQHPGPIPATAIFYGTYPGTGAISTEAVGYDAAHAIRFDGIPNVTLFPAHHSPHAIVEYFRSLGVITELLGNRILGMPLAPLIAQCEQDMAQPWMEWLDENISRGCADTQLIDTLVASGTTAEAARTHVARARLLPVLRSVAAH